MLPAKSKALEKEARRVRCESALAEHKRKQVAAVDPLPALAAVLLPYKTFFVNDPTAYELKTKSSNRDKQLNELIRHSFAKYRVPPFLAEVWARKPRGGTATAWFIGPTVKVDLAMWYICVAQGGSLYKEHAKQYLTKKEVHVFLTASQQLSFEQQLIFASASTFAENDGVALRLARSKLSRLEFTEFLKTVVYFFSKHPPVSIEEVDDLTDFIMAKHGEHERLPDGRLAPPFTLAGLTLDSLRKKTKDWHHALARVKVMGSASWEGAPLPDEAFETTSSHGVKVKWYFTQIKTAKALAAEGNAMRHCVYGYKDRCVSNKVYIWSLAREEQGSLGKKVTIELTNDGRIVQARGVANRVMKADERHVVRTWASKHALTLVC